VRGGAYFYKKWLRSVCGLTTRIIKRVKKRDWGDNSWRTEREKKDINDGKNGDTGESKDDGTKRGTKKILTKK